VANIKKINLKDFGKELEEMGKKYPEMAKEAVFSGVVSAIPLLIKKSPVDTGLYAQSWNFTLEEQSIILGNYAPHAAVIEYGARPFTPPLKPLLEWAKRVLKSGSQPPEYDDQVWALAVGTQNKIRHYGMKPKHILLDAIPDIIKQIKKGLGVV
jgi:hypothetical protein